jgi:hypothetical protein
VQRRQLSVIAMVAAIAVTAGACATSADTTAVDAGVGGRDRQVAPTSTIVRTDAAVQDETTTTGEPSSTATGAATDPTTVLTSLLAQVAADPALVAQLGSLDAVGISNLLGIDLGALQQLGLTPDQITAVAQGVLASTPSVRQDLLSGAPDPAVLLGLLAGSLDLQSLTDGTIATLVQGLISAVTGTRIVVSPELTLDLGKLLGDLDPDKLGPIVANPSNASLLALLTSVWLGSNPLFTRQLLANPQLDPALRSLLTQLETLSDSIGETARNALLAALYALIPALDPTR